MSPIKTREYLQFPDSARKAGVLALFYPSNKHDLELIFIKRPTKNPMDKHGGQVSFPGGQIEQSDRHMIDTALRETEEEIGIPSNKIKVLGQLSPIYVYVSNFIVTPVVGFIDFKPEYKLQESEVDYVITSPLTHLIDPHNRKTKDLKVRSHLLKQVPYFDLQGEVLWGATAMMTSELLHIISDL
ncbi:MAG: CoA pyrophosphatase [Saprospiraceae bacterium]|nr:CoA pyrophosphatase [Saprospiraceae bacterium]